MNVQSLIYIYLAICLCMIVYNLVCILVFKHRDRNSRRRDNSFEKKVKNQILCVEQGQWLTEKDIKYIIRKCSNVWNLAALDEVITELDADHHLAADSYIQAIWSVFSYLAVKMPDKDDIQQAHFSYIVCKYKIVYKAPTPIITDCMFQMILSENLYVRENALKVIYSMGDPDLVTDALFQVFQEGYFHHEKLLVEGLLSFSGDREELMRKLMKKRPECSLSLQLIILNFVRFGSNQFADEMYEILKNEKENDELRFSALRYFGKYPDERAYPQICNFAEMRKARRWEYGAISATVLASYPREHTIRILKQCLSDYNWFVRANAAESLEKFNLGYIELSDILDSRDRYAREILQYRMELRLHNEEAKKKKEAAAV